MAIPATREFLMWVKTNSDYSVQAQNGRLFTKVSYNLSTEYEQCIRIKRQPTQVRHKQYLGFP